MTETAHKKQKQINTIKPPMTETAQKTINHTHNKVCSNSTYTPEKHADSIGDQEGVIQDPEQCLIVVLVWRDDTDQTISFLHVKIYNSGYFINY